MMDKDEVEMQALRSSLGVQGQVETLRLLPSVPLQGEHQEGEGEIMATCECGCGQVVNNRFVLGHNGPPPMVKGEKHHLYGTHPSIETRRKLSKALTGKTKSKEHRRKLSKALKGKHPTVETRRKLSELQRGRRLTREHRMKIGKASKGRHPTEETKRKMSDASKGERNPNYGKHPSEETRKKMIKSRKKFVREHPDKMREGCRKAGLASIVSRRRNYSYYIGDTPFDSEGEKQAMIILCEKFNIVPMEGINCHVNVNGGEIDFRPTQNLFIEYHPWKCWKGLANKQYYDQRRKLLDDNGFQNCRLVVVNSLKELEVL